MDNNLVEAAILAVLYAIVASKQMYDFTGQTFGNLGLAPVTLHAIIFGILFWILKKFILV